MRINWRPRSVTRSNSAAAKAIRFDRPLHLPHCYIYNARSIRRFAPMHELVRATKQLRRFWIVGLASLVLFGPAVFGQGGTGRGTSSNTPESKKSSTKNSSRQNTSSKRSTANSQKSAGDVAASEIVFWTSIKDSV